MKARGTRHSNVNESIHTVIAFSHAPTTPNTPCGTRDGGGGGAWASRLLIGQPLLSNSLRQTNHNASRVWNCPAPCNLQTSDKEVAIISILTDSPVQSAHMSEWKFWNKSPCCKSQQQPPVYESHSPAILCKAGGRATCPCIGVRLAELTWLSLVVVQAGLLRSKAPLLCLVRMQVIIGVIPKASLDDSMIYLVIHLLFVETQRYA